MTGKDWFISGDGKHQLCSSTREWDLLQENYRLYRFLTEVEDILKNKDNESICLPELRKASKSYPQRKGYLPGF